MTGKALHARVMDALGAGDASVLDEVLAPDVVDHNPLPDQAPGREGFKQWFAMVREAFPDVTATVEDALAEGDLVAARVTYRATHRGPFVGLPATGRTVEFAAFHIVRISGGRIVEWWGLADLLGAVLQIGGSVAPPPGPLEGGPRS